MITVHPPPTGSGRRHSKTSISLAWRRGLGLTVALRAARRRSTPLERAIANNPIHTVTLATKFPPEFLQEMEDQTVMSRIGGELDSKPTGDRRREALAGLPHGTSESPLLRGFQALMDSEWPEAKVPEATVMDVTSEQIRAFLAKGAQKADAARHEFNQVVTNFQVEREDLHKDMQLLHADQVDPQSIDGIVEESIASRPRSINSDVAGVVSMLALIRVAQQSSAATIAKLTAAQKSQFD